MERVPYIAGDKYSPDIFAFDPFYAQERLSMAQVLARAQQQVDALSLVSTAKSPLNSAMVIFSGGSGIFQSMENQPKSWGANLLLGPISPQNCMKMKRNGPGTRSWRQKSVIMFPSLDPPMILHLLVGGEKMLHCTGINMAKRQLTPEKRYNFIYQTESYGTIQKNKFCEFCCSCLRRRRMTFRCGRSSRCWRCPPRWRWRYAGITLGGVGRRDRERAARSTRDTRTVDCSGVKDSTLEV